MTYSKDQLKKWSGGNKDIKTTYSVPTIKFNGNTGKFTKFPAGDFKNGTDIPGPIEITILRLRRTFTSFEKSQDGPIRMFSNEHNTWRDHITVFEARPDKRIKVVGSGYIEDLRNELPTLRINTNMYCLYDKEVHRITVKGKSRQNLVDYQKQAVKDRVELFEKEVKLTPNSETGDGGNVYYFLEFEATKETDVEKIGPSMEEVGTVMDKIDDEYTETNKRLMKDTESLTGEESNESDDIPIPTPENTAENNDKEKDSDEIKVEDIPF